MFARLLDQAHYLLAFQGLRSLQNYHPLFVHFPIAFLFGATLVYASAWAGRRESWAWTGLWMLLLSTLGGAASVWTGLGAWNSVMLAQSVRDRILVYHRTLMLIVFALSLVLSLWALSARPMPRRGRTAFVALLLATVALITIGADFGGWMVYGYNAGGSLPQPIEFSP